MTPPGAAMTAGGPISQRPAASWSRSARRRSRPPTARSTTSASPGSSRCWSSGVRAGGQVVLVSSGAIAAGLAPLGLPRRPPGPGHPAGGRQCGSGAADGPVHAAFAARGCPGRAGPAHRRRPGAARPLPQCPAHPRPPARTGHPCRWSTRTTRSPPTRSGSATTTGSRRSSPTWSEAGRADPALRRGRPLRHRPAPARRPPDRPGQQPGRPRRGEPGSGPRGHRRDDHEGGRGHDRDQGRHTHRGGPGRPGRRRAGRRARRHVFRRA